jgi:hypothetical protein
VLLFIEPVAALLWSVPRLPAYPKIPPRGHSNMIRRQVRLLGKPVPRPDTGNTGPILRKYHEKTEISQANAWNE